MRWKKLITLTLNFLAKREKPGKGKDPSERGLEKLTICLNAIKQPFYPSTGF